MSAHGQLGTQQAAVLRAPRSFKVVEVATSRVLAEGTDARVTIETLTRIASIFDVWIYVWHPAANTWRQLTPGEQRTLWDFRVRCTAPE